MTSQLPSKTPTSTKAPTTPKTGTTSTPASAPRASKSGEGFAEQAAALVPGAQPPPDPGQAKSVVRELIGQGILGEHELTNEVFWRQNELMRGTKLKAGSREATQWQELRDTVVRPEVAASKKGSPIQAKMIAGAAKKEDRKVSPVSPEKAQAASKKSGAGSGFPLPAEVRERFEKSFGADLSAVRIHESSPRAQALKANAFAEGFELHFAPGKYDPDSKEGAELLGHELAHVVQQQAGRVAAPLQGDGAPLVQDQALEVEADIAGARAARGEAAGLPTGGASIARPAAQGYFTLNDQEMQALWQREKQKERGERATFHGQETGSDVNHPDSFTDDQSETNLVVKKKVPSLRVSEDANMAIEDADFTSRQAKNIFLDGGLIGQSNAHLRATRSRFRLKQVGGGLQVPGDNGLKDLVQVVAQSATNPSEMGDELTTPQNCNEMGGAVSGGEISLDMKLTTTGEGPRVDKQDKAIRTAQYVNTYAQKARKNRNKNKLRRKKGQKLDKHLEKEAQASTGFAYPEPQDQEWLKPMREFTVNDARQFKTELLKALGTNMLIWEERPEDGYFKVMVSEDDQLDVFESPPLADLITNTVVLPPFKDVRVGKANKAEKIRLLEEKQDQIATTYGTLPQNELDETTSKLGLNEYIEPEVGDALEILPVGVPDQNKDILDHRKPQVDNGNGPEKQKVSALFPYHWGGVVARSGPDYVTLENYARNEEDGNKRAPADETRSYFQMYGSKRALNPQTQSFHEFWGRFFANPLTINHSSNKKREVRNEVQPTQPDVTTPDTGGQLILGNGELDLGINPHVQDRIQALDDGLQGQRPNVQPGNQQQPRTKKIDHGAPRLSQEEQARVQRVKQFLGTLSNIRIGFEKSPGFGHQSATVATMDAIREIGYTGWFEIVYEPENAPKLHTLMPGDFDKDGPALQVVANKKLKFVGVGNKEAPKKKGEVGLFGANDHGHSGSRLNTDYALTLQPFEWHQTRRVEAFGEERLLEPERTTPELQRQSPMAFQYDVNSPDDPHQLVDDNLPNNPVLATNLKALLDVASQGAVDMQAIYGLTDTESELGALVDGVRWAQNNGPTNVRCGATIIAMIPGVADNMVPQNVQIIDLATPGADQALSGLGGTDIAVVKTGRMPQPLFRELYRTSSLPPVLEGANTANFMRLTGLPYMNFFSTKTPFVAPFGGDTDFDYQPVLDMLKLAETTVRAKSPQSAEAIGRVLIEAKDPNSLLVDFFAKGGEESRGGGANQVVIGLDELRKEMTKEPPPLEMLKHNGRVRHSASIARHMIERNRDLDGKDADVETVVKHFVHTSRSARKGDEAMTKSAESALKEVGKPLRRANVDVGDLADPQALQQLITDVSGVRDVWARRKGGKATAKKLTKCVDALTALSNHASTDAPSPDKDPRGFAKWLEQRAPFDGHMPLPGQFPNNVQQAAMRLVPPPVVGRQDDQDDDTGQSSLSDPSESEVDDERSSKQEEPQVQVAKTTRVDTPQDIEPQSRQLQPKGGLGQSLKPETGNKSPKQEKLSQSTPETRDKKKSKKKEKGGTRSPKEDEGLTFTSVKILNEGNAVTYHVKTEDGRDLVLKYQGANPTVDDYTVGCAGNAIGLKYPVDDISIHMEGSAEEKRYTQALKPHKHFPEGSLTVMPFLKFTENEVAMDATAFTNLGKCFAYDIFIFGKDRFPITDTGVVNNLFMQGNDPLLLDTPNKHGNGPEAYRASMRDKLEQESRDAAFEGLYQKALETASDKSFDKKVRTEMKQAFHAGIQEGMKAIFENKDEILEHARRVDEMNKGEHGNLMGYGLEKMFDDLREVLKAKKSMHSEGKVYKFLID